ncbi:hypothetical protein [Cyclobacterium plantarum]|uniref:hypothetical protein n=1 Tax=Cyclobacterium plantarum TaxID=2716263 RepID=UPI003F72C571
MKYYTKNYMLLMIPFSLTLIACNKKYTSGVPEKTNYSINSDCSRSIDIFNKFSTENIIYEIIEVSKGGSRINELKILYPEARDTWNKGLSEIESSYSSDWSGITDADLESDQNEEIFNSILNQGDGEPITFFELLTELKYGRRPVNSRDVLRSAGWDEKANVKNRLNVMVKILKRDCRNQNLSQVRNLLNPIELPQNFEDCLNYKFD